MNIWLVCHADTGAPIVAYDNEEQAREFSKYMWNDQETPIDTIVCNVWCYIKEN